MPCYRNNSSRSASTAKLRCPSSLNRNASGWYISPAASATGRTSFYILKPDTLPRWHRQGFRLFCKFESRNRDGRPKLSTETINLIKQMTKDNLLWGAERIRGELLKLGIRVATATIQKYMRLARPRRPPMSNLVCFSQEARQERLGM